VNGPAPLCGCLRCTRVRRRTGNLRASGALGHPAAEIRRHRTNGDGDGRSGDDGATGAALHSGEKRNGFSCGVVPGEGGALTGVVALPRVDAPACCADPGCGR
jgi:hypothetical protein